MLLVTVLVRKKERISISEFKSVELLLMIRV
jgi:hypothetical protein